MVARYLDNEVKPRVGEPSRAELLAAFQANRDQWRRPPRRSMSLIDVRVLDHLPEGVNNPTREQQDAARSAARAIAQTAWTELESGVDFADVAKRYSDGLQRNDYFCTESIKSFEWHIAIIDESSGIEILSVPKMFSFEHVKMGG